MFTGMPNAEIIEWCFRITSTNDSYVAHCILILSCGVHRNLVLPASQNTRQLIRCWFTDTSTNECYVAHCILILFCGVNRKHCFTYWNANDEIMESCFRGTSTNESYVANCILLLFWGVHILKHFYLLECPRLNGRDLIGHEAQGFNMEVVEGVVFNHLQSGHDHIRVVNPLWTAWKGENIK